MVKNSSKTPASTPVAEMTRAELEQALAEADAQAKSKHKAVRAEAVAVTVKRGYCSSGLNTYLSKLNLPVVAKYFAHEDDGLPQWDGLLLSGGDNHYADLCIEDLTDTGLRKAVEAIRSDTRAWLEKVRVETLNLVVDNRNVSLDSVNDALRKVGDVEPLRVKTVVDVSVSFSYELPDGSLYDRIRTENAASIAVADFAKAVSGQGEPVTVVTDNTYVSVGKSSTTTV